MTNIEPRLEVSFVEAANGVKKTVDLRFLKKCPICIGKSPKRASRCNPELCNKCNGAGELTKRTPTFTSVTVCDQCNGKRYVSRNQCETCDNRGIILETVKVVVPVPPGITSNEITVTENPVTKQRVHYRVIVQENDYYERKGNNIHSDHYISISDAVLGGSFKVTGIYGDMIIKVTPGTESHSDIVVKGKGIKTRDGVGDHIVTVKIRVPQQLSVKQRQLILALSKTEHNLETLS